MEKMKDAEKNTFPLVSSLVSLSSQNNEEIPIESSEVTLLSHSSYTLNAQKNDTLQKLEDGDSIDITNVQVSDNEAITSENQREVSSAENTTMEHINSSQDVKQLDVNQGLVDTAAPIESVKEAVSKFGGIVDWKAHKIEIEERRKYVKEELEKVHEVIPEYKKQSESAEKENAQVLKELDSTKRLIEELKMNLERAQTEEGQAKQDSELAKLWLKELKQGIANEASFAAKAQLEVAKTSHEGALLEMEYVKGELEALEREYISLLTEKEMAMKRAEDAVSISKEVEKRVEELTLELIGTKKSLESAHAAHLEAEELRIGATMAREQDSLHWENELKLAEEEIQKLNMQLLSAKELESKLDTSSALLLDLKDELSSYMETKVKKETGEEDTKEKTHMDLQENVASAKRELEEVRLNIGKATAEVNCLRVAAMSLKKELEKEKSELAGIRQREGKASVAVSSLEAEVNMTMSEISLIQMREKESRDKMVELPKQLRDMARDADEAKSLNQSARKALGKAKEEAEQAKASASTIESRLHAAQKEIEASMALEKLALGASKELQESKLDQTAMGEDVSNGVTLSLEEYYRLRKEAQEAEEKGNLRVAASISQVEVAKESELRCLEKLEEMNKLMATKKEALRIAMEKAEKAKEGKLGVEQELRMWRAENEKRRKANDADQGFINRTKNPRRTFEEKKETKTFETDHGASFPVHRISSPRYVEPEYMPEEKFIKKKKKKKKSIFPKLVMFLCRKKANKAL